MVAVNIMQSIRVMSSPSESMMKKNQFKTKKRKKASSDDDDTQSNTYIRDLDRVHLDVTKVYNLGNLYKVSQMGLTCGGGAIWAKQPKTT